MRKGERFILTMNIAEKIRQVRAFWELRQQDVADICGVTISAVSHWENGKAYPRIQHLRKLADHLGIPINTLITDDMKVAEMEQVEHYFLSMDETGQELAITMLKSLANSYPKERP